MLVVRIIRTPNRRLHSKLTPMNLPFPFSITERRSVLPARKWISAGSAADRPTVIPSVRGECRGMKLPESRAHTMVPM